MWVKICGNTNLEDALFAVESGADALGFIFAESPRRVDAAQVRAMVADLPQSVEKIGIFAGFTFSEIVQAVEESGLTGVQLHDSAEPAQAERLRERFGPLFRILRVVHFSPELEDRLAALKSEGVDGILIDSRTATAIGGTGITFDWQAARRGVTSAEVTLPVIVAGGLNAGNVAEAIATLQPWGVDVSSGVESSPGKKDLAKVKAFLDAARLAGPIA